MMLDEVLRDYVHRGAWSSLSRGRLCIVTTGHDGS